MKEVTELYAFGKKGKHKTVSKKNILLENVYHNLLIEHNMKPPLKDSLISRQSILFQVSFLLLRCTIAITSLFLNCTRN